MSPQCSSSFDLAHFRMFTNMCLCLCVCVCVCVWTPSYSLQTQLLTHVINPREPTRLPSLCFFFLFTSYSSFIPHVKWKDPPSAWLADLTVCVLPSNLLECYIFPSLFFTSLNLRSPISKFRPGFFSFFILFQWVKITFCFSSIILTLISFQIFSFTGPVI